jgi:DNA-binding LytR/AlgR family response regulator
MAIISCIIVDDEPLARDLLEKYIRKTTFLELKMKCSSAIEALESIGPKKIDLIFLDIQMPELSGIEFSRMNANDIKIIFTTAYSDYAIEGYKVNALDYLLKPFSYAEFLRAANKAKEWFELRRATYNSTNVNDINFIFVKSEYKQIKVNLNEVLYFEGLKDYIKIWIKDQPKPIMTIMRLKLLEEVLPPSKFMRVHRSFIIALDKIQMIERNQVIMGQKIRITIADQYKEKFHEFISGRSIT